MKYTAKEKTNAKRERINIPSQISTLTPNKRSSIVVFISFPPSPYHHSSTIAGGKRGRLSSFLSSFVPIIVVE